MDDLIRQTRSMTVHDQRPIRSSPVAIPGRGVHGARPLGSPSCEVADSHSWTRLSPCSPTTIQHALLAPSMQHHPEPLFARDERARHIIAESQDFEVQNRLGTLVAQRDAELRAASAVAGGASPTNLRAVYAKFAAQIDGLAELAICHRELLHASTHVLLNHPFGETTLEIAALAGQADVTELQRLAANHRMLTRSEPDAALRLRFEVREAKQRLTRLRAYA